MLANKQPRKERTYMSTQANLIRIKPSDITVRTGFNTRHGYGDLRQLMSSIKEKGFDPSEPVIVAESAEHGKYILGAQGHRRLAASLKLEASGELKDGLIYAVLETAGTTATDRNLDIIRLNTGEPLSRVAEGKVMLRAMTDDKKLSQRDLAERLGYSSTHVDNTVLVLKKATEQTLLWIEDDKVSFQTVLECLKENGKDGAVVEGLIETMIKEGGGSVKGKKKKEKKEKTEGEPETDEEKAAREAEEAEEKENDARLKKEKKENADRSKRVNKFDEDARKAFVKLFTDADAKKEEVGVMDKSTSQFVVILGSFLRGTKLDVAYAEAEEGDVTKLSDVWQALRQINKAHAAAVKSTKEALEADHESALKIIKEDLSKANKALVAFTGKPKKEKVAKEEETTTPPAE